jgi:DNA-directed RNA polymerase subunit RPC12/RpoP
MGTLLKATCDCGYSGKGNCSSSRREHGRVFHYPHLCTQCQEVVSPDLLSPSLQCPNCGNRELVMYGTVEAHQPASARRWWRRLFRFAVVGGMGGKKTPAPATQHPVNSSFCFILNKTFSISREQYKCPKCGEQRLRFQLEALYD